MHPRIVVFAKAPVPGLAKTRLIPALGAEGAAALARRLLAHQLTQALAAGLGGVELCMSPAPGHSAWDGVALPAGVTRTDQGDGDLGARLARAAFRVLSRDGGVLLIGTDCPALDADSLRAAALALATHGAALLPAADGGYVLLGLTRHAERLFSDVDWGTPTVAATTRARFAELGWPLHEGPTMHDIDLPVDLAHWPGPLGDGLKELACCGDS